MRFCIPSCKFGNRCLPFFENSLCNQVREEKRGYLLFFFFSILLPLPIYFWPVFKVANSFARSSWFIPAYAFREQLLFFQQQHSRKLDHYCTVYIYVRFTEFNLTKQTSDISKRGSREVSSRALSNLCPTKDSQFRLLVDTVSQSS